MYISEGNPTSPIILISAAIPKLRAHAIIKIVNQHRQKYQHNYAWKKQSNSLANIVWEPRVRIKACIILTYSHNHKPCHFLFGLKTLHITSVMGESIFEIIGGHWVK
jgi:hypothetical protein